MGRLNVDILRYLTQEDLRVLTAVEMGMKNHEFVADKLVKAISGLRCSDSSVAKVCRGLCQHRLLAHADQGYRLTVSGYDCLALKALVNSDCLAGIGSQIGVGKESDVYLAQAADGADVCLKLHRLGRTSFRQLKNKRDYLGQRRHFSWLYASRLSAQREYQFLQALHAAGGLAVPRPLGHSRHAVVMEFIADAATLNDVAEHPSPMLLYEQCRAQLVRLAELGLIHGDFNEFNLLLAGDTVRVIDLPQCLSRRHPSAAEQYRRDCRCVVAYFEKRFGLDLDGREPPDLRDVPPLDDRIDVQLRAPGFNRSDEAGEAGDDDWSDVGSSEEEEGEGEKEEKQSEQSEADESEADEDEEEEGVESSAASKTQATSSGKQVRGVSGEEFARRRVRAERRKEERKAGLRAGRRAAKRQRDTRDARDMHEELATWG